MCVKAGAKKRRLKKRKNSVREREREKFSPKFSTDAVAYLRVV